MANEYRTWYSTTEQEYISSMHEFLEHVVGWYRTTVIGDGSTDRRYSWASEGEAYDKRPPRGVSMHGISNEIRLDGLQVRPGRSLASFGSYVGASAEMEFRGVSVPGRCRTVASKDRVFMHIQTTSTIRMSGYIGHIDSFYSPADDPTPILVRAPASDSYDWTESSRAWMRRSDDGLELNYSLNWDTGMVNEGYPNPRNGQYTFRIPEVYYGANVLYNEVRGRLKGLYLGRTDRLAHGSFVSIGGQQHLCTKSTNEVDVVVVGPVSPNGQVPVNRGWQLRPNLEVDYTQRGMQLDTATSGTLALWRFDTGHLNDYVYGSGSALPVPTTYVDTTTNYDLTPQNGLTSVQSRLREAADFDGSTHYTSAAGDGTSAAALKDEWTFECVFTPDAIPTVADRDTLMDYGSAGAAGTNNTLIRVAVSPAAGTTPDEYLVERGNIEVSWEKGTKILVSNTTTQDFVQQGRWNYLAITKRHTGGSSYDIDIWHCSFGDHVVPVKKATFTGMDNAASGTSSNWYIGATEALADYFDGKIDDTRVTQRVLTDDEIIDSCSRSML